MVEFALGKNIKVKSDKMLIASETSQITAELNAEEQILVSAINKQSPMDKIKEYSLGSYKVFVCVADAKQNALDWQKSGACAYKFLKNSREVKIKIIGFNENAVCDFAFGLEMASYRFDKYFTKKKEDFYPKLERVVFTGIKDFSDYKDFASLANCVRYARDLTNEPANHLTPEILASDISRLKYLGLDIEVFDEQSMKEKGFNLAYAVGQGSANRPRIAVIKWNGNKNSSEYKVGLVGKGVTFDSGGISLKPANNMWDMKQDMAGAAVMIATMKSLALEQCEKNVVAVVGLVENMPSGSAYRPGDVVTSMSGQTVEVQNTDAEGRLVLADCLTYIQKEFKPEYVIDMATLTGAIVVALGNTFAGLFSNNEKMTKTLKLAGDECGERLWQMPMDKEYDRLMDSDIADMKNIGGRNAGSATAACFLSRFVEKNTKWAHIDIAGMDLTDGSKAMYPKGASGFGVLLLSKFMKKI